MTIRLSRATSAALLALLFACSSEPVDGFNWGTDPGGRDDAASDVLVDDGGDPRTDAGADTAADSGFDSGFDSGDLDGRVGVVTFNVRRFFDTTCDSGNCDDGFESVLSEAQFNFRANQIADAIEATGADIALLQEIESQDCLDALVERLDGFTVSVLGETGGTATLDVAVVARAGELLEVETHRDIGLTRPDGSRTTFAREFLGVHLGIAGDRVIVFTSHFKSQNNDDPGRRLAEASAARDIVTAAADAHPDALVVFGGDLNDTPGSEPLDALETDGALFRVASLLPPGEDATHEYRGEENALDHIYLAEDAAGIVIPETITVFRDASGGFGGSDHAALSATFAY